MPYRQLPATSGTTHLISDATAAALQAFHSEWELQTTERADALGRQTSSTAALDAIGLSLRLHASHFFQVYQFGVARGIHSPSGRAGYDLSR